MITSSPPVRVLVRPCSTTSTMSTASSFSVLCEYYSSRIYCSYRHPHLPLVSTTTTDATRTCHRRMFSTNVVPPPPTTTTTTPLSSLQGPPVSKLVPPGQCQFGEDFQPAALVDRVSVSPTSSIFRFALPDPTKPLNLSTCACILAKAEIDDDDDDDKNETEVVVIVRPYTPISTNALVGYMDLLIKDYGEKGTMSKFLHNKNIDIIGDSTTTTSSSSSSNNNFIQFKHIAPNVKIQAPFFFSASSSENHHHPHDTTPTTTTLTTTDNVRGHPPRHIVMLAGGTGITPMIQALHAILGQEEDDEEGDPSTTCTVSTISNTKVTLLYGNQSRQDILGQSLLDTWANEFPDRLQVVHVLSEVEDDVDEDEEDSSAAPPSAGAGIRTKRGMIDRKLLEDYLPVVDDDDDDDDDDNHHHRAHTTSSSTMIFVCGPPAMYQALCGPREEQDTVSGILGEMGYSSRRVYKF